MVTILRLEVRMMLKFRVFIDNDRQLGYIELSTIIIRSRYKTQTYEPQISPRKPELARDSSSQRPKTRDNPGPHPPRDETIRAFFSAHPDPAREQH